MIVRDSKYSIAGIAIALALSGCAAAPPPPTATSGIEPAPAVNVPLPTYYGLYAIEGGQLVRLDGSPDWEQQTWSSRDDLPADISFLLFSRQLADPSNSLATTITVGRVASVGYERTAGGQVISHPPGSVWASPNLPGYQLTLEFEPIPGHPDMMIAKPEQPLSPGLYALKLTTGNITEHARFGVGWPSVQQSAYAAQYCVELDSGGYQPCGASAQSSGSVAAATQLPTADFVVQDLHSHRVTGSDGTPTLLIEGRLINESSIPAIMPALSPTLLDAQNQVLQALPAVTLPGTPLAPGAAYNFRINVSNPAPGAAQVRVTPTA